MKIKYKLIKPDAVEPSYMKDGDAGLDLTATSIVKNTLFSVWYNTDIAIEIPKGHFGMLVPRSSITNKSSLTLSNSVGIIDAGFRGGIQIRFNRTLKGFFTRNKYQVGERVAQLIIVPFKKVILEKEIYLSNTDRAQNGFGSTNK